MKKLKLLLIPLFSLLFIVNVNADTTFTSQTNTPLQNCLSSGVCTDESDFWNNILSYNDLIQEDTTKDYYVIYYDYSTNNLWYIRSNNQLNVATNFSSGTTGLYLRNSSPINYITYTLTFNSSGQVTSMTSTWGEESYSGNTWFGLNSGLSLNSIILATNQEYIKYSSPTWTQSSFTITGSGTYNYEDNVTTNFLNGTTYHWNVRDIFTPTTTYCYPNNFLGQLENVSAFSVVVKGKTNALNHNLTGSFDIISNKNVAVNEWNTQFNANVEVTGRHQMNCINNRCEINFDYNIEDDIDEDITLVFTYNTIQNVSMPTRIQFNSCSNYDNISEIYYTYINDTTGVTNNNDTSLQNNINDTNINGANGYLNDLLNNEAFTQDNGLLAIIQAPINFINSLSSKTCQSFSITIPFINATATIPCMSTIYNNYLGTLFEIIRVVINGILCYRIALSIVLQVKDARNPNSDKIEVMDL